MDSFMEALVNTIIGLLISVVANHVLFAAVLGIPLTLALNVGIAVFFTVISIARSYLLRRLFNGRSAWAALRSYVAYRVLIWRWNRMKLL
jgi:hypothetical protein